MTPAAQALALGAFTTGVPPDDREYDVYDLIRDYQDLLDTTRGCLRDNMESPVLGAWNAGQSEVVIYSDAQAWAREGRRGMMILDWDAPVDELTHELGVTISDPYRGFDARTYVCSDDALARRLDALFERAGVTHPIRVVVG